MMYFDIFLPGTWSIVADPGKDAANGVHMDGPGPMRAIVYAAVRLNPGRWQCLVTGEQLDAIEAAGVPFLSFSLLPTNEKAEGGGPAHVFGDRVVEKAGADVLIYRPGKAEPEVIAP